MQRLRGLMALLIVVGCGRGPRQAPKQVASGFGYALEATGGTYSDGSGAVGLAVLSTVRDAAGAGPSASWTASISDSTGVLATAAYDDASPGSYAAWWWASIPFALGETYSVDVAPDPSHALSASFVAGSGALLPPVVDLSADGRTLTWAPVDGAATYLCEVLSGGTIQLSNTAAATSCDVSALPIGSYGASVLALSFDPTSLTTPVVQSPSLPTEFDVAEGRLAFVVPGSGSALKAQSAGGVIDDGTSNPGLAVWLAIANADGTVTAQPWSVSVLGPGIPSNTPFTFTYPASTARFLVWSYDLPAAQGAYSLTASSSLGQVAATFTVGAPTKMDPPLNVNTTSKGYGEADTNWQAVLGAQTYYASAWDHVSGVLISGQWVTSTSAHFPNGTFTPGTTYDVYVAATDASLDAGMPAPTQVTVSENTYNPSTFTAQ